MNQLEIIGLIAVIGIAAAGVVIKRILRRKLRDMDGVSEVFDSHTDENIIGKL